MDETEPEARSTRRPAGRKSVTPDWLMRAAGHYLERYASSSQNLRQVLERKVRRRLAFAADAWEEDGGSTSGGEEPPPRDLGPEHHAMIAATLLKLEELKLIDDRRFAENRFATLRAKGTSLRQARAKLSQKGVERELVGEVAVSEASDEIAAARIYAKRRRLGPHRGKDRAGRRERDIAAMMRAGFSLSEARLAIDEEVLSEEPSDREPGDEFH